MVKSVIGDASERKIQQISLSNDTMKRRINEMSDDIKEKVIQEIKSSPAGMFAIHKDTQGYTRILGDCKRPTGLRMAAPDDELFTISPPRP